MTCLLIIDQGTTSTRAIVVDSGGNFVATHRVEIQQYFPFSGWVEHDPEEIWLSVINCCKEALNKASLTPSNIAAIGITNQRETTALWEQNTGKCLTNAIVWQDRRTAEFCNELKEKGLNSLIYQKTGLLLDPYFCASKIAWILSTIHGAKEAAEQGKLLFGTIDSFLLWRFTKGKVHATDVTNASRTLLFNIHQQCWDDELLNIFSIPKTILPQVFDNNATFGRVDKSWLGSEIPILALIGDQQAAMLGQACITEGDMKSTYGTGCFLMINTGAKVVDSGQNLLATIAYRINNQVCYALEGSIFAAGTIIKWLRDKLGIIKTLDDSERLACSLRDNGGVYFVPAFTGLGAPYWDANARGAIYGLTRDSSAAHIVRAGLEAVAYQTQDLLTLISQKSNIKLKELRVDGGLSSNSWVMQFLADVIQLNVLCSKTPEATALGCAYLTALSAGHLTNITDIKKYWELARIYYPLQDTNQTEELYKNWKQAVARTTLTDF